MLLLLIKQAGPAPFNLTVILHFKGVYSSVNSLYTWLRVYCIVRLSYLHASAGYVFCAYMDRTKTAFEYVRVGVASVCGI